MPVEIVNTVSVRDRASTLGCEVPMGLTLLPLNFETASARSELRFSGEAATVRTLFRINNVPLEEFLPSGERVPSVQNKHSQWEAALFISGALLSAEPNLVSIALNVLSNYLTDYFKGSPRHEVKLTLVVERSEDHSCKKLTYEGDVSGLQSLSSAITQLTHE